MVPSSMMRWTVAVSRTMRDELAAGEIAPQLAQLADRLRDVDIDRIELLDGGEVRGAALLDQRALGEERAADPPADRGADVGVVEVELGAVARALAPATSASACFMAA